MALDFVALREKMLVLIEYEYVQDLLYFVPLMKSDEKRNHENCLVMFEICVVM